MCCAFAVHFSSSSFSSAGNARHAAFVENGERLLAGGTDGHVYVWDMKSRRCVHKFVDEGAYQCTSMTASPKGICACVGRLGAPTPSVPTAV